MASYKGTAEQREAVWQRQVVPAVKKGSSGGGRDGGAGLHVVLTTYDFLMSKADK